MNRIKWLGIVLLVAMIGALAAYASADPSGYSSTVAAGALPAITLTGDTVGSGVAGTVSDITTQCAGAATGLDAGNASQCTVPAALLQNGSVLRDGTASAVAVTSATPVTIYTEPPIAQSTVADYVIGIVCVSPYATDASGDAGYGDLYRADFSFDYQRLDAGPVLVGSNSVIPLNVRTSGSGAIVAGASITTSNGSVVVQFGGAAHDRYDCSVDFVRVTAL